MTVGRGPGPEEKQAGGGVMETADLAGPAQRDGLLSPGTGRGEYNVQHARQCCYFVLEGLDSHITHSFYNQVCAETNRRFLLPAKGLKQM